jgi:Protein of unknown function (DUF2937)
MFPFRLIHYLLDRLFVVIGAFLGSQIPAFMQQYTHRLVGHVNELEHLIQNLRQVASYSNKTLEVYIQKFLTSADSDFVHQGQFMEEIVGRWEQLRYSLQHFQQSLLWQRPFVFIQDLQSDIARSTFDSFQPGFNLNLESLCYAGLGLFLGFIAYQLLTYCLAVIRWVLWKGVLALKRLLRVGLSNKKRKDIVPSSGN